MPSIRFFAIRSRPILILVAAFGIVVAHGCTSPVVDAPPESEVPDEPGEGGGGEQPDCATDAECDDQSECTRDSCTDGVCIFESIASLDDGVFCNGTESCVGGAIVSSGSPCAGSGRPACDEPSRSCFVCESDADCDDANACTQDICTGGECVHESDDPDDGVFCNGRETCNRSSGAVSSSGDPCEGSSRPICIEGEQRCIECESDAACDDGNACTADSCGENGSCVNTPECSVNLHCAATETCSTSGCCRSTSAEATIGIVPLVAGPYARGELVEFDLCVRRATPDATPDIRLLQFDFTRTDTALGEPIDFEFETGTIAEGLYGDFSAGRVYNLTFTGRASIPGVILNFAGEGACSRAAGFSLIMPTQPGEYLIDVLNDEAPDNNRGALIQHNFELTVSWWSGDGSLDGGRLVVRVE